MDSIRKQARLARRRMITERFLGYVPWTLGCGLMVALVGLSLQKLFYIPAEPMVWLLSWVGGALAVALLCNTVFTLVGRPSTSDAAIEIDRRFGLRERLSSAMVMQRADQQSETGQALMVDANRRAETIDIRDQFHWGFQRKLLVPVLPALLVGLMWYVPNREATQAEVSPAIQSLTQIKNSTKTLMEQVKKSREQAEKEGLAAAVDMFKRLEGELARLQKEDKLDSKQTLAKLNNIKDQIAERKKELGSAEDLKKSLQNLEKFESGPAEKFADALKQGDFEKAEESLQQLMKKMQAGEMSDAEMQQLQKQLEQLKQAMTQSAAAQEQAKQQLQEQIKQAEAAGDMQKAAQLQRKMEQLQAQDAQMSELMQMADALSQAQQAMQQGDLQTAQESLEQLASQLQQMNQADAQLQDLDQLMDSLAQSKSQMMCQNCNGMGCSSCMGSMAGQIPGMGMGEGAGSGERPEEENDVDHFDSRVRAQMNRGEIVAGGKVGGDNRKGITQVEIQDAVLTSLSEEPEPLDDTPLPKNQRDHSRDYFNSIRDGR